ncbi:hypothetical protein [Mesorhizobium sp.]|uniref:hypothetical protein n=1 Tax=Mesorhizobium sp. TaxID=1871066 RepID=UPI0025D2FFD2|nr:hypothetical protein [Mesorhizobium sp.]
MKLRYEIGVGMFAAVRIIGRLALPLVMGVVLAISAGIAQAGDAAARHIIGFSPDGAYFAFEQYGTLDAGASDSGWSQIDIMIPARISSLAVSRSSSSTRRRRRH